MGSTKLRNTLEYSGPKDPQGQTKEKPLNQALTAQSARIDKHERTLNQIFSQQLELGEKIHAVGQQLAALVPNDPVPPCQPGPTPPASPSCGTEPTVHPSKLFAGDPKTFGGFLFQCELAFSQAPIRYISDAARITYIVSALKGEALQLAYAHLRS